MPLEELEAENEVHEEGKEEEEKEEEVQRLPGGLDAVADDALADGVCPAQLLHGGPDGLRRLVEEEE